MENASSERNAEKSIRKCAKSSENMDWSDTIREDVTESAESYIQMLVESPLGARNALVQNADSSTSRAQRIQTHRRRKRRKAQQQGRKKPSQITREMRWFFCRPRWK